MVIIQKNNLINYDGITDVNIEDYLINIEKYYIQNVIVGSLMIFEIIDNKELINLILENENDLYFYTGFKELISLKDKNLYTVEINNELKEIFIGKICNLNEIKDKFNFNIEIELNNVPKINIINARCHKSMCLLDDIHRKYIDNISIEQHNIIGIKSVAGSGKKTTLLNITKKFSDKKILYTAFNKSLITEIKQKIKKLRIKNLEPRTFDSLMYKMYSEINNNPPSLNFDFKPQLIGQILPDLECTSYNKKKYYHDNFIKYCKDSNIHDIKDFTLKVLKKKNLILEKLWEKVKRKELITYDTIRKEAIINHWLKDYIDSNYDLILIDETQDFDMIMLKMLLNDTTIPKIFVGDPKQAIYQFRGCINAFNYLPSTSLIIEFYSTFRVGNPCCDNISGLFNDCWMISKSKNETHFVSEFDENDKYTYLCRTWKHILSIGAKTKDIWINDFDKKYDIMLKLHSKIKYMKKIEESEDDLPNFLKTLSFDELKQLLTNVLLNTVRKEQSKIKIYTVHSYKGLEDNNIRIANDINKKDVNVLYVALTRGMKKILVDKK